MANDKVLDFSRKAFEGDLRHDPRCTSADTGVCNCDLLPIPIIKIDSKRVRLDPQFVVDYAHYGASPSDCGEILRRKIMGSPMSNLESITLAGYLALRGLSIDWNPPMNGSWE